MSETSSQTPAETHSSPWIVGLGASAGGLKAIEAFFRNSSRLKGVAYVIVQHLSPDFSNLMDELLVNVTDLPILHIEDGMRVKKDVIYLIPPRKTVTINNGALHLHERNPENKVPNTIDSFLFSLALAEKSRAISVILSGTGSDGARGCHSIFDQGGLILCQDPGTTQFDGMPRAVINDQLASKVLKPEEMPSAIEEYIKETNSQTSGQGEERYKAIQQIFRLLEAEYQVNFAHYKNSTIERRIERRLRLNVIDTVDDYVDRLQQDTQELDDLYHDLLIGVTEFFRDEEAYQILESGLLVDLLEGLESDQEIRVWVPACATGEEAYSLAILLYEQMEVLGREPNLKILATDLHKGSLGIAARGVYSKEAVKNIRKTRLDRFFTQKSDGYHVVPELRKRLVFVSQNVIKDAPFTNIDLVSCRNLLIYFTHEVQQRVLSLFHFSLKTNGLLWLGPSEAIGELGEDFDAVDASWRIFRKRKEHKLRQGSQRPILPVSVSAPTPRSLRTHSPEGTNNWLLGLYDRVLATFMPPGLLLNEDGDILHTFGGASTFLTPKDGRPSSNVLDLVDDTLHQAISTAMRRVKQDMAPAVFTGIQFGEGEKQVELKITVRPFPDPRNKRKDLLLLLESQEPRDSQTPPETIDVRHRDNGEIQILEEELRHTRQNLSATITELQNTNEELQSANEELISGNEELQSTNEELHSVNEELYTVNAEYQRKIDELTEMTDDMDNLLNSTSVHTIFLDRQLRIRKFTPGIANTFYLIPQDVGRRIDGFKYSLSDGQLIEEIEEVLETGEPFEREVHDRQSRTYLLRLLPYLSQDQIEGVVLTLIDITLHKEAEAKLEELSEIVQHSDDAIFRMELDGTITTWNRGAEKLFDYEPKAVIGKNVTKLIPTGKREELRELLIPVRQGSSVDHFETQHIRRTGETVDVSLTMSPIYDHDYVVVAVSLIARDITERKRAEAEAREAVERRDQFLAMLSHELRNPLGAVLNAAYVLDRESATEETKEQAKEIILRQGVQMRHLLDDLLDVSRVTQGKIQLKQEHFDLKSTVSDAIDVIRPQIEENDLEFQVHIAEEPLPILGDAARLQQVQVNLLKNAVKYTPPGESIFISLKRKGDDAVLSVRDTGMGIPTELLKKIFDLFVQSNETLDRSDGGMGVGLTLVRSVVELHQGTVTAHSEGAGCGSEFVITLPLELQEPADQTPETQEPKIVRRIVLVEDLSDTRTMLKELLELEGFEVAVAADGPSGLERIRSEHPDLALVDIGLPGMDGYEIARTLRKDKTYHDVSLVALTGYGQESDRLSVMEAGFDEHLVKPLQPEELTRVLEHPPRAATHS